MVILHGCTLVTFIINEIHTNTYMGDILYPDGTLFFLLQMIVVSVEMFLFSHIIIVYILFVRKIHPFICQNKIQLSCI